jgi:hypothetical protein
MVELTRNFAETVKARVATDEVFRAALQNEIARLRLSGDGETAKALLLHLEGTGVHLAVRPQPG